MDINEKNNKKLSKVLSTKLSKDDYNAFLILTKLEYQAGLIKEESTSELLRFTIRHILNLVHNQPEYLILKNNNRRKLKTLSSRLFIVKLFYRLQLLLLINVKFLLIYLSGVT
jgi:hypothetical protein